MRGRVTWLCILTLAWLGGGCVHRPAYGPWPSAGPSAAPPTKAPEHAKVVAVRFVQDLADDSGDLDSIELQLDRPVDPLTVSAKHFGLVGADRRLMRIQAVRLGPTSASKLVLQGHFGDGPQTWASSLAVHAGLYAADGLAFVSAQTLVVPPPNTKEAHP